MRATLAARPLIRAPSVTAAGLVLGVGLALLVVVLVAGVGLGTVGVGLDETAGILARRLLGLPLTGSVDRVAETIIVDLRLPRVLTAMLVGAGLACAGTVFQALLRNPLADPYVIGTAAGASFGAVSGMLLPVVVPGLAIGAAGSLLGLSAVQGLAFAGGLGAVLVVYGIARTGSQTSVVTLLLTGYAVSSVLAAGVALLMFTGGRQLAAIVAWLMGSLAGASWADLAFAAPLVAGAFTLLLVRWRRLNVLLLGDEAAAHLGVEVGRERLTLTVLATLATSACVAVSGTIGFVGLVVPHLLRLLVGPDHRLLLPASCCYGAVLLTLADTGARLAGGIPVGVVTALLGAPFFVWLLRRGKQVRP
jgi:iron complex transport system permease protein